MKKNGHHLLFDRPLWELQKPSRSLRRTPELIFPMYEEPHGDLHRKIGCVPVMNYIMAERVSQRFEPVVGDRFKSVDKLLFALEATALHYRDRPVEHELLNLVALAIDLQRPYIREGLIED